MYFSKRVKKITAYFFSIMLFILSPIGGITVAVEAEEQKEIDINTNVNPAPNNYLFNVSNLKPGDWMPRNLEIRNDGKRDFKYTVQAEKVSSIKGLYEELELLVKKGDEVLFDDKLPSFTGLTPRNLAKGTSETLFVQVKIPFELGNEYQGSAAAVKLIFLAEAIDNPGGGGGGTPDDDDPPGGGNPGGGSTPDENPSDDPNEENPPEVTPTPDNVEPPVENPPPPDYVTPITPKMVNELPNTATNMFNYLLAGTVFVGSGSVLLLFHGRKRKKSSIK